MVAVHEHVYRYAVALCNDDGQRAVEMADAIGDALERLATLALKAP